MGGMSPKWPILRLVERKTLISQSGTIHYCRLSPLKSNCLVCFMFSLLLASQSQYAGYVFPYYVVSWWSRKEWGQLMISVVEMSSLFFSVFWCCWFGSRKHFIWPVKPCCGQSCRLCIRCSPSIASVWQ